MNQKSVWTKTLSYELVMFFKVKVVFTEEKKDN